MSEKKATYVGDLCFSTGEYESSDGETRKSWTKAAACFKNAKSGKLSFKFEALPASPEWSGFMTLFPAKARGDQQSKQSQTSAVDNNDDMMGEPIDLSEIPF